MSSILDAKNTQFRLAEDGTVSYQAVESNPTPGDVVAKLVKGETHLKPNVQITDAKGADEKALMERLEEWRDHHIGNVLELIVELKEPLKQPEVKPGEPVPAPMPEISVNVRAILDAVYDSMGILPREKLEELIAVIDTSDRRVLRAKRVRLGPILVFIPALNKPAGVRLRALLWTLYNGGELPADVPNDGIVSKVVDGDKVNKDFYQAIGYPVFGNRAIRIDMLDRVICAVYDSADKGKFRAQHQMAEWLGCPIEDLYAVLSAMGHKKIEGSAEIKDEDPETSENAAADSATEEKADEKQKSAPEKKPELAEFYLKRGKAFEQKSGGERKNFKKTDAKKNQKSKGKGGKPADRGSKVMSAKAKKVEDSPFAILEQLKSGNNE